MTHLRRKVCTRSCSTAGQRATCGNYRSSDDSRVLFIMLKLFAEILLSFVETMVEHFLQQFNPVSPPLLAQLLDGPALARLIATVAHLIHVSLCILIGCSVP